MGWLVVNFAIITQENSKDTLNHMQQRLVIEIKNSYTFSRNYILWSEACRPLLLGEPLPTLGTASSSTTMVVPSAWTS